MYNFNRRLPVTYDKLPYILHTSIKLYIPEDGHDIYGRNK